MNHNQFIYSQVGVGAEEIPARDFADMELTGTKRTYRQHLNNRPRAAAFTATEAQRGKD